MNWHTSTALTLICPFLQNIKLFSLKLVGNLLEFGKPGRRVGNAALHVKSRVLRKLDQSSGALSANAARSCIPFDGKSGKQMDVLTQLASTVGGYVE